MNPKNWSVAMMGAGALGGYYGARLMQAGHTVHFIARGAILAAMQGQGLRVVRDQEEISLPEVSATDDPGDVGEVDLVMVTVKGNGLDQAARAMAPMVRGDTVVLPLLNGVGISERISDVLGRGIVLGGLTFVPASVPEPGVVRQTGDEQPMLLGSLVPEHAEAASKTTAMLKGAGLNAALSDDIRRELWNKSIVFMALVGTEAVERCNLGEILANPDFVERLKDLLGEGETLARAVGVDIEPGLVERTMNLLNNLPSGHTVSVLQDLKKNKPLELETTLGAVLGIAGNMGVPTPALQRAYDALMPYAGGAL